jgi:hypothetical protein
MMIFKNIYFSKGESLSGCYWIRTGDLYPVKVAL